MAARKSAVRNAKSTVNPHIAASQQRGKAAAKVVRKNASIAASKTKTVALSVVGGAALGAGVVWAFGSAFARGLRG